MTTEIVLGHITTSFHNSGGEKEVEGRPSGWSRKCGCTSEILFNPEVSSVSVLCSRPATGRSPTPLAHVFSAI
ncbi:uncharacterized protein ARMOST_01135 [Armillaria ostoyae]|uniref:Uncharacterized protein n=1 Tax=Armillaria ostoyae TaxID=47428 RepID=A0A284QN84_ARMOS|nr:uncharacterized protein ARMOST_01135 [Armillaria ostoyae]